MSTGVRQILDASWRERRDGVGEGVATVSRMTAETDLLETVDPATQETLLEAIDVYFRPLHSGDVSLLDEVFHPAASLFDADEGPLFVEPLASWRAVVDARQSPADVGQPREEEILLVDWLSPLSAVVKVRLRVLDQIFVDHLSFVIEGDRFRIV